MDIALGLQHVRRLGAAERWLAALTTLRPDGSPSVSVVNAGVIADPLSERPTLAFVARSPTAKLSNLRTDDRAVLLFRHGWDWVAVHGRVTLIGPHDRSDAVDDERLRRLLRDIYFAAGGSHPDPRQYDRVMADEGRTAVLVRPRRIVTNPPGTEHEES